MALLVRWAEAAQTGNLSFSDAVSSWKRDSAGRIAAATDPLGCTTTYTRDSAGYITRTDLPDGNYTTAAYQVGFHAMTASTDALSEVTTYGYEAATVTDRPGNDKGARPTSGRDP